MLHSLLNNPTWLPESSSRPSQLDSTAAAFIHLESWGKVENADELSGKLQSLRKIDSRDMGYLEKGHDFVILCFHWR